MLLPLAPTLETLALGGNKLGGTITDDIASFTKLTFLGLGAAGVKGTLIAPHATLGKERRDWGARARERGALTDCSRRALPRCAGAIPESIGSLTNLQELYLGGNALTGA